MNHQAATTAKSNNETATLASVWAGLLDVSICLAAVLASHSVILLADFLKTFLEWIAVLTAWAALWRIKHGGNHKFDYGIGKLENITGMVVGNLMIVCLLIIGFNAIRNILHPAHVAGIGVWIGLADQVLFAGINVKLGLRSRRMAQSTGSPIMGAQARLMLTRAAANVFIMVALGLSVALKQYHWAAYIDPLASLIIAASILMAAMGILSSSFYDLLDRTLEEESQIVILRELAERFHEYEALHGIRSRRSGSKVFIEIFLEFAAEKTMGEIQKVAAGLRRNIEARILNCSVTIALADRPLEKQSRAPRHNYA